MYLGALLEALGPLHSGDSNAKERRVNAFSSALFDITSRMCVCVSSKPNITTISITEV